MARHLCKFRQASLTGLDQPLLPGHEASNGGELRAARACSAYGVVVVHHPFSFVPVLLFPDVDLAERWLAVPVVQGLVASCVGTHAFVVFFLVLSVQVRSFRIGVLPVCVGAGDRLRVCATTEAEVRKKT